MLLERVFKEKAISSKYQVAFNVDLNDFGFLKINIFVGYSGTDL